MPNNALNVVRFEGPAPVLDKIRGYYNDPREGAKPGAIDFSLIVPQPKTLCDSDVRDWRRTHWGDIQNSYDGEVTHDEPEVLHIRFTTAWRGPTAILEALLANHPELSIEAWTLEEANGIAARYHGRHRLLQITMVPVDQRDPDYQAFLDEMLGEAA